MEPMRVNVRSAQTLSVQMETTVVSVRSAGHTHRETARSTFKGFHRVAKPAKGQEEVIMFKRSAFMASEGQACVDIEVLRLGPVDGESSVQLCASVVGGEGSFKLPPKQTITFQAGEKKVNVPIYFLRNRCWTGIRIECISLSEPKAIEQANDFYKIRNVKLGPIKRAKLMVSEFDRYPDGRSLDAKPLKGWRMVRAFLIERARNRRWKLLQTLLALTYLALFGVLDSLILKFVIDIALGGERCGGEEEKIGGELSTSVVFGCAYMICFACCHLADRIQLKQRGRSGSRKWLRANLIHRYLYLSDVGVQGIGDGEFINILASQVDEVVNGWYHALLLYRFLMDVIFNLAFQIWLISDKVPILNFVIVVSIVFPIILATILCRQSYFFQHVRRRQDSEDKWMSLAEELVEARGLLQRYDAVERQVRRFKKVYEDFYKKHRLSRLYQQTSEWLPKWALALALASLYAFAPRIVAAYSLSASDFAAFVKSLQKLRKGTQGLHKSVVHLQRSTVAIHRVANVLNREDRVGERSRLVRSDVDMDLTDTWSVDDLDILLMDGVSFAYGSSAFPKGDVQVTAPIIQKQSKPWLRKAWASKVAGHTLTFDERRDDSLASDFVFKDLTTRIPCSSGDLVFVTGAGRRTLFRMIAELVHPTQGFMWFSPHRRCLLVDRSPHVIKETVFLNLRLGRRQAWEIGINDTTTGEVPQDARVADIEELKKLCGVAALACGVSQRQVQNLDMPLGRSGLEKLTLEDAVGISLARAMLAHPGALFIDSLGDALGPRYLENFMLPVLKRYAQGGLYEVVQRSELVEPNLRDSLQLSRRHILPVVFWSSKVLPRHLQAEVDVTIELERDSIQTVFATDWA